MGYLKSIGTVIIYIGFFLAIITFLPGLRPEAEYSEYSIKQPSDVQDQIELKNLLQGAEILLSEELIGPESFASYNGEIYTGIRGGYVVKIEEDRIKPVVKFGKKCDGLWQEEKCGRPLGLKFNDKGELFVADAYYGIFKTNVHTKQYVNIVNSSLPINGKVPKIVNSLDIAKNGDIYWTDSSTEFSLHDGLYTFLTNPSGRLIRYNAAIKKNEVLLENLGFANGVLLSDDESFVIVLESLTSRIIKYNLKGPNAGQSEIFAEALPGLPDNVHSDGQGGFLVSLIMTIDAEHPFLPQSLTPHPYIRKMLSRLLYFIEAPFKLIQDIYPNYYAENVIHSVGLLDTARIMDVQKTSILLRINKMGKILDALHSEDRKVYGMSSAYIHNGYLWLGSPWNNYLMRVPLKQALPDLMTTIKEMKEESLLTVSSTSNIKVKAQNVNAKSTTHETTTELPIKSTVKIHTTQKQILQEAQKQNSAPQTIKSSTISKATSQPTTTTQKPTVTSAAPKLSTKQPKKKDNTKQVETDNLKDIRKENSKEIKKNKSNSDIKQASKRNTDEIQQQKSDDSVKKSVREAQPAKSKPVEKKDTPKKK